MTTRNIRTFIIVSMAVLAVAAIASGAELERHNPYTVLGLQLRANLIPEETAGVQAQSIDRMPPVVFQEIVPCRLVSTLEADHYALPWGGPAFVAQESRAYDATGLLLQGEWTNPCSERIPVQAIALSIRLQTHTPQETGIVWLSAPESNPLRQPALPFVKANDAMDEANVMLAGGRFSIMTDASTDLTVDVIGYFLPDPYGAGIRGERGEKGEQGAQGRQGEKGEKGDKGDAGVAGAQGEKGEKGDKGDAGVAGAQGEKGEKGDRGEQGVAGPQGPKGDKGDAGVAGAQGEKGDRGEQGVAGPQGPKGDKGDAGVAGAKGEKGEKGDRGEQGLAGPQGPKGDKGDAGVAGAKGEKGEKGDRGEQGLQGAKGDKGDKGDTGAQGAMGPMGPMGPQGPQGPRGAGISAKISGALTFPPPGSITIRDSAVTRDSIVLVQYVEVSNGNAIAVASQSDGSFVASGSPNKKFRYYVLNIE